MDASAARQGTVLVDEYLLQDAVGDVAGSVYSAQRKSNGQRVAVRLYPGPEPDLAELILDRARRVMKIHHPMLASVLDCGIAEDGTVFVVSEFVDGAPLTTWADTVGIPPLATVVDFVHRLCVGLQVALRAGITHDLIGPHNVLVLPFTFGPQGRLAGKLLDLGVPAAARLGPPSLLAAQFMAPEQLIPVPGGWATAAGVSTGANVYSVGAILYYLCTGGSPYPVQSIRELVQARDSDRQLRPSRINPSIPGPLNTIMVRALSRDPSQRYPSVSELAEALAFSIPSVEGVSGVRNFPTPPGDDPESTASTGFEDEPTGEIPHLKDSWPASGPATLPPPAHAVDLRSDARSTRPSHPAAARRNSSAPPLGSFSASPSMVGPLPAPPLPKATARMNSGYARTQRASKPVTGDTFSGSPLPPPPPPPAGIAAQAPPNRAASTGFERTQELEPTKDVEPLAPADEAAKAAQPGTRRAPEPATVEHDGSAATVPEAQDPVTQPEVERVKLDVVIAEEEPPMAAPTRADLVEAYAAFRDVSPRVSVWRRPSTLVGATLLVALLITIALYPGLRSSGAPESKALLAVEPAVVVGHAPTEPSRQSAAAASGAEPQAASASASARIAPPRGAQGMPGGPYAAAPARPAPATRTTARAHRRPVPKPVPVPVGKKAPTVPEVPEPEPKAAPPAALEEPALMGPAPEPVETVVERPSLPETREDPVVTQPKPAPTPEPKPELPLRARARLGSLEVQGSLATSVVRRAIERGLPDYATCYRTAAQQAGRNAFGSVTVSLEIDLRGRTQAVSAGASKLAGLSACVRNVASKLATNRKPDIGTVKATFDIAFAP